MPVPFDYVDISRRAERLADQLHKTDRYADDTWRDPVLGPLVRVYALLTHRPHDAFDEPVTAEYIAECRTYARLLLASVYDGLVGAQTFDDAFFDLLSEYDSLVDAKLDTASESAKSDGQRRLAELRRAGNRF